MHDIRNEDLIVEELESKERNGAYIRSSFINDYFLHYIKEKDEILPIRYYDGAYMSKPHIRTLIKGLENFLDNELTDEQIEEINEHLIRENQRQYEESYERVPKSRRQSISKAKEEAGYVYFIKEHFSGKVKIGKTKHMNSRMEMFGVKLPFEWDVIKTVKSADYSLTETLLHRKYENKRVNGEWFDLTQSDIDDIMNEKFDEDVKQSISGGGEIYERK